MVTENAYVRQGLNAATCLKNLVYSLHLLDRGHTPDTVLTEDPEEEIKLLVREHQAREVHEDIESTCLDVGK